MRSKGFRSPSTVLLRGAHQQMATEHGILRPSVPIKVTHAERMEKDNERMNSDRAIKRNLKGEMSALCGRWGYGPGPGRGTPRALSNVTCSRRALSISVEQTSHFPMSAAEKLVDARAGDIYDPGSRFADPMVSPPTHSPSRICLTAQTFCPKPSFVTRIASQRRPIRVTVQFFPARFTCEAAKAVNRHEDRVPNTPDPCDCGHFPRKTTPT